MMTSMVFLLKNWIFLFILGLSIIIYAIYGLEISTEYFRVNNRSKYFKKCTGSILNKPEHGIRVSELTGKCEKTTSDDIKEAGYSYAETESMEKKFTKPVENFEQIHWNDSKGISPGFRFDLYWSKEDVENYNTVNQIKITFTNASHRLRLWFFGSDMNSDKESIKLYEQEIQTGIIKNNMFNTMPIVKAGQGVIQLSILAQSESLKIMFDNKDFLTYQLETINTNNMHNFTAELVGNPYGTRPLFFHGYRLSVK